MPGRGKTVHQDAMTGPFDVFKDLFSVNQALSNKREQIVWRIEIGLLSSVSFVRKTSSSMFPNPVLSKGIFSGASFKAVL